MSRGLRPRPRKGSPIGRPGRPGRAASPEQEDQAIDTFNHRLLPAMAAGDYERAIALAYRILKKLPRDENTWVLLIDAAIEARLPPEDLLQVSRQAVKAVPGLDIGHLSRIDAAEMLGEFREVAEAMGVYLDLFGEGLPEEESRDIRSSMEVFRRLEDAPAAGPPEKGRGRQAAPRPPRLEGKDAICTSPRPGPTLQRPARTLRAPVAGPDGAAVVLELEPMESTLSRLVASSQDGPEATDLAVAAAEAASAEGFDRLLALDAVRDVDRYPHQVETVLRTLKRFRGRVLLADEVGLGKTIEAGLVLKEYLIRGLVRRALILCPPALVSQWKSELEEKFDIEARTTQDPAFRRDPGSFFEEDGVVVASLATARTGRHREILLSGRFDLVIADEAHHLKNRSTRGWELVNALRSRFLLMLTASPVQTNLDELYNLVTLLRPGTLGAEADFRRRFRDPSDPLAPRQPERLRDLLRDVMIRNTRSQSGVDLPPRTARTLVLEGSPEERALYNGLVHLARRADRTHSRLFRLLLEGAGSSPLAVARTAGGASPSSPELGEVLREVEARSRSITTTAKVEKLVELLPGGKVLVFTRFLATHGGIASELDRRGIPFIPFTGGMSGRRRAEAVASFRDEVDVMLCSEVGGEGQNLQFCHRLINFDLPWNPMLIEQRIGRIHRIGQREPVEVINLCTGGTAEEKLLGILDRRVNLFELVVGEMDLLLGELEDERDFSGRVYDIYAGSRSDEEVSEGFERLGDLLARASERRDGVRAADETIFGQDLGA